MRRGVRVFSFLGTRRTESRLRSLLDDVRRDPKNVESQVEYLQQCSNQQPAKAVQHFEELPPEMRFDSRLVKEYFRALFSSSQLLDKKGDFVQFVRQFQQPYSAPQPQFYPFVQSLKLEKGDPVQVTLVTNYKTQLWTLLTRAGLLIIFFAGVQHLGESVMEGLFEQAQTIGVSKTVVEPATNLKVRLDDVKGCSEVKAEVEELIDYLKSPDKFLRLGAKLPKGMMLSGPPGTGKTLLARAMAGEAGVPFLAVAGSEFEDSLVGVGARRIRDLFKDARKHAPCIIFIDEIDAIAGKRDVGDRVASPAHRQALNQLLVEMDGFEQTEGIILICATNSPDSLDPALTRPGRLDKMISMPYPDLEGRREILKLYGDKVVLDENVCLDEIAKLSSGMCGADLFNIVNIAAVRASAENKESISQRDIENAFDRVIVGLERKSPMSREELLMTAYHEGGHALALLLTKGSDRLVHKVTILPRGQSLGVTWNIPESEKSSTSRHEYLCRLDMMMAGKAAEELVYGIEKVTSGCSSDLQNATELARRMIMNYGMGDSESGNLFLDSRTYSYLSEESRARIDRRISALLDEAYCRSFLLLKENREQLDRLAEGLLRFETLSRDECELIAEGKLDEVCKRRGVEV